MAREPYERHEHVEQGERGEEMREMEDLAAERQNQIRRITGVIWLVLGVLEALLALRVILKLLTANPFNAFASFIYDVSHVFLAPFFGLVGQPSANGHVLEVTTLVAMLVYFLIAWVIVRLIEIVMTPTRVRHLRTTERH